MKECCKKTTEEILDEIYKDWCSDIGNISESGYPNLILSDLEKYMTSRRKKWLGEGK